MSDTHETPPATPNQDPNDPQYKKEVPAGDPPTKQPQVIDPKRRSGAV